MDSSQYCSQDGGSELSDISDQEETDMDTTTIAVDLAKNVFEIAIAEPNGAVRRRRLSRMQFARFLREAPPAQVVMEACATAHHWGRTAQACGHRVTLLPPRYVRPFVRRQKTDQTDTLGLLDAQRSPKLQPVAVKTIAQQELLALHRIRRHWIGARTARINALHGLLGEFGLCFPKNARRTVAHVWALLEDPGVSVPGRLRRMLAIVLDEIRALETHLAAVERELVAAAKDDLVIDRLMTIPGVGLLTATALAGSVGDIHAFRRARHFASWLGLTPKESSSGQRRHLGAITKQGDTYLRALLVHGARAVLQAAERTGKRPRPRTVFQKWALGVKQRRGASCATVAVANKTARIIWALWTRERDFIAEVAA